MTPMVATIHTDLSCVVVTPERALLDEKADFVVLPMYDGELGVLPGRAPLIGRLGYGELRTRLGNETHRFFVDGGFAQVRAEEINPDATVQALEAALAPAATPEANEARHKAQERARGQLRVARRAQ